MKKIKTLAILFAVSAFMAFIILPNDPATNFLNSLNKTQREKAQLNFDDKSKKTWHFIPGSMFPRAGIMLNEMNSSQKKLLNALLQAFLSETGYVKTKKIIDLENVLLEISGDSVMRNSENYFIAFYGNPEKDDLWAWSFEGHHISLNFTVLNDNIAIAPRFFGANPATILSGTRKGERTLKKEEDLGLQLINSLTSEQRKIAIFNKNPFFNIVTKNKTDIDPLNPVGIKFQELNRNQQIDFLQLLDVYLSTMPVEQAQKRMKSIKNEEMDEVRFGWAGATTTGKGHYYRIQGKSFLIEFENIQNNANHIHSVWRDFDGDFGKDLIKEHYEKSNHH